MNFNESSPEPEASPTNEFHEKLKSAIKISTKNKFLSRQLRNEVSSEGRKSLVLTDQLAEEYKERHSVSERFQGANQSLFSSLTSIKLEPGTCFLWYIIKTKSIRDLIPDYELYFCKKVFTEMLRKNENCFEACFGLGKLLAHNGDYSGALRYIEEACRLEPNDVLYKLWHATLHLKTACSTRAEALVNRGMLESILVEHPGQLEALWGLMELALSGLLECGRDIEFPGFYASRIKELDTYYGYFAWTEVIITESIDSQTGVSALKELIRTHPGKPEAYIKLWRFYYYQAQAYDKVEDIAAEAFLRITDEAVTQYNVLFCILYAKSFYKNGKLRNCLELLQQKFMEHPQYPVFLYQYGKLTVKSGVETCLGSALGALQECLNICEETRHGLIHYWLAKGYLRNGQKLEAYSALRVAVQRLNSSELKKKTEATELLNEMHEKYSLILRIEEKLNSAPEGLREVCAEIQGYEPSIGESLLGQVYWAEGDHERAIATLIACTQKSSFRLTPYFVLFKLLRLKQDFPSLEEHAKELVHKSRNSHVPTSVWVNSIIVYSKALAWNGRPEKGVHLLKCIAKVYYPCGYVNVLYTKILHRAESLEDLVAAAAGVMDETHSYSSAPSNRHSISRLEDIQKRANGESSRDSEASLLVQLLSPSGMKRRFSFSSIEVVDPCEKQLPGAGQLSGDLTDEDVELALTRNNEAEFTGDSQDSCFSFSSSPQFLYEIAKISYKHQVAVPDGICAVSDYLCLLKYEMSPEVTEIRILKASALQALLLYESKPEESTSIMNEILPALRSSHIQKYLELIEQLINT